MTCTAAIKNLQRRLRLDRRGIKALAEWVLRSEGCREGEVSLVFLNDAGIRELNRRYLGRDYPTDVLAFPQNEGPAVSLHPWFLGDVVVSTERVVRQAPEHGQSAAAEFALCLIHGVLHLLGYRDRPVGCRRKMSRREEQLLRSWKRKKRWSLIN